MKKRTSNCHIVPKVHLKRFCIDQSPRIWCLNLDNKFRPIDKASIKKCPVIKDFYVIDDESVLVSGLVKTEDYEIVEDLLQEVENDYNLYINKLLKGEVDDDVIDYIGLMIGMQLRRAPTTLNQYYDFDEKRKSAVELNMEKVKLLSALLGSAKMFRSVVMHSKIYLVRTDEYFVTSDSPVFVYDHSNKFQSFGGNAKPDQEQLEVEFWSYHYSMPVTSKYLLVIKPNQNTREKYTFISNSCYNSDKTKIVNMNLFSISYKRTFCESKEVLDDLFSDYSNKVLRNNWRS